MINKRLIYSTIFEHRKVGALSPDSILIYLSSILNSDDMGRCKFTAPFMRSQTFQYVDKKISEIELMMREVLDSGLVLSYEHGDEIYVVHPQFHKWQKLSIYKLRKIYPDPPEHILEQQAEYWEEDSISFSDANKYAGKIKGQNGKPYIMKGKERISLYPKSTILEKIYKKAKTASEKSQEDILDLGDNISATENKIDDYMSFEAMEVDYLYLNESKTYVYEKKRFHGDQDINKILDIIEHRTKRQVLNTRSNRRFANILKSRLVKKFPKEEPAKSVLFILEVALNSKDRWHRTKCHDPQYLSYNYEEILANFKEKTHKEIISNPFKQ